eukprot:c10673_g1_i1.p1 GENE.c10673_g1_i1~~c10673_g1_i1.p1  ORF type:complete len:464 (+),score=103.20 c10673_g1_i1:69-1394(+)
MKNEPLLQIDDGAPTPPSGGRLLLNFFWMTICFSINHGTVTALISLATSTEGHQLGSYSLGALYGMYTFVALFFSNVIVDTTGYKWGLVSGLGVYCVYVVSCLIYKYTSSEPIVIGGSAIGGIAAGFLWTAQGGYFNLMCTLYAKSTGQAREAVTASFGGWFAAVYLGGEVTLKLLSSALSKVEIAGAKQGGTTLILTTFSIAAVASTFGMMFVEDPQKFEKVQPQSGPPRSLSLRILAKVTAASNLLLSDPKMVLLLPAQMAFGFMAGFINATANDHVIKTYLGSNNIGYVVAITPITATLLTIPIGYLTKRVSKVYLLVLGGVLFATESLLFLCFPYKTLGTWVWCGVIYAIHGAGRCIFESTNKAVMADFFEKSAPAAFANVIWSSGGASTVAFFLFPEIHKTGQLIICLIFACLQIVCSIAAFSLHTASKNASRTRV